MQELWDLYDENRNPLGRIHVRGVPLKEGEYHLVVDIWTITPDGRILIDKRHPDKPWGGLWECSGGSVTAGEDSLTGAIRELEEEIGIKANTDELILIGTFLSADSIVDTYVLIKDVELRNLVFQKEEVTDAKFVTFSELEDLIASNLFAVKNIRYNTYRDKIAKYAKP